MSGRLVGICGYAGSGKDEAGLALIERGWQRLAFADALKDEVCVFLGITIEELERRKDEFRPALVARGEHMRWRDSSHWVSIVDSMRRFYAWRDIVVTDVRYLNEAQWVEYVGGILLYVWRPGVGPANEVEDRSIAEIDATMLLPAEQRIRNGGTIADLHAAVCGAVGA